LLGEMMPNLIRDLFSSVLFWIFIGLVCGIIASLILPG
jgi:hypothetical protein